MGVAAVAAALVALASITHAAAEHTQLLDASPFFLEPPEPRDNPEGHVGRFQGLANVDPAEDTTSQDHVPSSSPFDSSDFQEERFDYPEVPEYDGVIPAFQGGSSDGEETYEVPETFHDIPEHTQAPEVREEQHQAPPASQPSFQDLPVADVTPFQEEELQLQAPNQNKNQRQKENQRQQNQYSQFSGDTRQQVNSPVPQFASPQYEESQDVVDVISAPRPSRSPPVSSRPRPPQYSQIPYRRSPHPNELPVYSSDDPYDLEAQGSREQYRVAYDYEDDLPVGLQGEELEDEEEEEPDRLSVLLLDSTFKCFEKNNGYYADEELDCEVFHYCQDSVKHSWLCPSGASFHQVHLICMPRSEDNICARSSKFHFVNDFLYKELQAEDGRNKTYADRYYPEGFEYGVGGTGGGNAGVDPGYSDGFGAGSAGGAGGFAGNVAGGDFGAGNIGGGGGGGGGGGFSSPGQPPHRPRRPRPNQQPPPAFLDALSRQQEHFQTQQVKQHAPPPPPSPQPPASSLPTYQEATQLQQQQQQEEDLYEEPPRQFQPQPPPPPPPFQQQASLPQFQPQSQGLPPPPQPPSRGDFRPQPPPQFARPPPPQRPQRIFRGRPEVGVRYRGAKARSSDTLQEALTQRRRGF